MNYQMPLKAVATCASLATLTACGVGDSAQGTNFTPTTPQYTSFVGTPAKSSDGEYSISNGTKTVVMTGLVANSGSEFQTWINGSPYGAVYENSNVLAIAGVDGDGTGFSGLTGTVNAHQTSGSAVYSGSYAASTKSSFSQGPISLTADFDAGTVTGGSTSNTFSVDGKINDGALTGSVTFNGNNADITHGGQYGTNELVGTFSGGNIGGVFYGKK